MKSASLLVFLCRQTCRCPLNACQYIVTSFFCVFLSGVAVGSWQRRPTLMHAHIALGLTSSTDGGHSFKSHAGAFLVSLSRQGNTTSILSVSLCHSPHSSGDEECRILHQSNSATSTHPEAGKPPIGALLKPQIAAFEAPALPDTWLECRGNVASAAKEQKFLLPAWWKLSECSSVTAVGRVAGT